MTIVGAFDVHRAQITFDCLDGETGEVKTGRILRADREQLRSWLERFRGLRGRSVRRGGLYGLALRR